jgi:GAF domain-containing protein
MTDTILPSHTQLADTFAEVAKLLIAAPDSAHAFTTIVDLGVRTVPGAQHSGLTMLRNGIFHTPVATDELPERVDAIQYELGSGPCVDAVLDDDIYVSGDVSRDSRWPEFGTRAAAETGVRSMLSYRLYFEDDDSLAGLNFYSTATDAFDETAISIGTVFATHAAIAVAAAHRLNKVTNLEHAVASNREIGIAIGILMATQLRTREQAFDLLRIASQSSHRKLRDIANDVAETGTLDLPGR